MPLSVLIVRRRLSIATAHRRHAQCKHLPVTTSYTTRHFFCNQLYSTSLGLHLVRVCYCSFCHLRALVCVFCAVLCFIIIGFSLLLSDYSIYLCFFKYSLYVGFLVLCVCFPFCVFCFFLSCILFLHLYIAVYLQFLYKFTDHCHRVEI